MNWYKSEIERITEDCFANQWQIDTVIGLREYMDNHFNDDLNLDLFSRVRFVSKYHLLRLFKRYYAPPKQYLLEKRIQKSKEFLKQRKSVSDTCFAVGFESLGSFSSLFKRKTGLTPTAFQRRATFEK